MGSFTRHARSLRLGLATLASLTVASPFGCSSDVTDADGTTGTPCEAPEIAGIDLPNGGGAIYACEDGELRHATTCPRGTACGTYGHSGFRTCIAVGVTVPFGVVGGSCNDGTRSCAPTDDRFLVCVNGAWADVCPDGFEFPASCSAVYADRDLSHAGQQALLSCASEGGRCGREGAYECDGQSAFRCEAGASVHVVDCPTGTECFANPDHAICGERFYAVPNTACFSDLQALIGPPSGTRFACAVDESAVLGCIDDVWGITEQCVEGARCGGQLGDISCE